MDLFYLDTFGPQVFTWKKNHTQRHQVSKHISDRGFQDCQARRLGYCKACQGWFGKDINWDALLPCSRDLGKLAIWLQMRHFFIRSCLVWDDDLILTL